MSGQQTPVKHAEMLRYLQEKVISSSRFGIPAILHCEALSGPVFPNALTFPTSISLGATFEPDIVREMADRTRQQLLSVGIRQALSPVLDVARDFRWGRVSETYGSDPTLIAEMTCAFVDGLQGEDYSKGVAATGKHFLGYSATEGGLNMTHTTLDRREIREVFAKPFEAAIRKSGLLSVMNSYSEMEGRPACASSKILKELLRDDLGFEGLVVSDYMSIQRLVNNFYVAEDMQDAAVQCLTNGLDVELPEQNGYGQLLAEAVNKGILDKKYIDEACKRCLELKFKLGLFEQPFPAGAETISAVFENTENNKLELNAARKAITLTKNDGILPLKDKNLKIVVIGPSGNNLRSMWSGYTSISMSEMIAIGSMSSMAGVKDAGDLSQNMGSKKEYPQIAEKIISEQYPHAKTITEALKDRFENVSYVEGCHYSDSTRTDFDTAVIAAKEADLAIIAVGGKNGWGSNCTKGEGIDSASITLPGAQEDLIKAVGEANKNFIVVHMDAYPLVSPYTYENAHAVVEGWLCCAYGGQAIAETLTGENNPGGKSPVDIPFNEGITPQYHYQLNGSHHKTVMSSIGSGYADQPDLVQCPFGFGLSYTTFSYSNIEIDADCGDIPLLKISVSVTNTGKVRGDEVVQLYGKDVLASIVRPYHELIGFKRITLKPDETKTITFVFTLDQLSYPDDNGCWMLEKGNFLFYVGTDSSDESMSVTFKQTKTVMVDHTKRNFFAEVFEK